MLLFPVGQNFITSSLRIRQTQVLALYVCMFLLAFGVATVTDQLYAKALALGAMFPGGGFLLWAGAGHPMQLLFIGLSAASILAFAVALAIWFATGNIILPALVWAATAIFSALVQSNNNVWQSSVLIVPLGVAAGVAIMCASIWYARHRGLLHRARLNSHLRSAGTIIPAPNNQPAKTNAELSRDDLRLMRLLLDRALQPVDKFNGFEWIDQFQTAAVRYQLNFMSYALSIAQSAYFPAFSGYLDVAQKNLIAKQQDHRVWRYWWLENIWGNLNTNPDPIPRDNIMLTGFLATQLALYRNASSFEPCRVPQELTFEINSGRRFIYNEVELIEILVRGYEHARHGLLACEPNWIYPLCNLISASAVRAHDSATGSTHWHEIAPQFRKALETQYIAEDGKIVPFRSAHTGIAAHPIGGAVMQAFPCFFLSALFPDIAQRQWEALRYDLKGRCWTDALWRIDVGNYRFSRASSYAATAAAAVEVGDTDTSKLLLEHLEEECPTTVSKGISHRSNASLWAHAVEMIARCGSAGAFHALVAREIHLDKALTSKMPPTPMCWSRRRSPMTVSLMLFSIRACPGRSSN